ncbi:MAG: calcium-binding protein [Pseudomonadota bacterium]
MLDQTTPDLLVGTNQNDQLTGSQGPNLILGLAGDDTITSGKDADEIYGDFIGQNLLTGTENAMSFDQYGASGAWVVSEDANGNAQMSQSVTTMVGAEYQVAFEVAANHASGTVSGRVEVLWNDAVIGTIDTSSGVFADAVLNFTGTGEDGTLTFRALPGEAGEGPEINTDGPVFWYEKTVELNGEQVSVKAFAEGQANIYQVLNGELNVFDPETETYTPAGAEATVVVNAIGLNQEDDLIYGIAVKNGTDALGNAVSKSDLVMYDAEGKAYLVGETPYRSWTGDFDGNGNLWAFHSSLDRITKIDVDQVDANGNPLATTYKFPKGMETDQLWDVAYDATSQSFFGLVRPSAEGEDTRLIQIDISGVEAGGEPVITDRLVTGTMVDGQMLDGVPAMTFGAFVIDADGNFYAGGNGGDHDMNDATGTSGGIYRIVMTEDGEAYLELVADAPKSYSNDGAVDPRAMDPFSDFDPAALVLIRGPELHEVQDSAESYNDDIHAGSGQDEVHGGYGDDEVIGSSLGDALYGGVGNDALYGGAGPDYLTDLISVYDEDGLRYDQYGNLLPEDDDLIVAGLGNDLLDGSAGHDTLKGGDGEDTLDGGTGHDQLFGDAGNDLLNGGRDDDLLNGGAGVDTLEGGSGDDTLDGGDGNDDLLGGAGEDVLSGGAGDDALIGGAEGDILDGGAGADDLTGGSGNDLLQGGAAVDVLKGGSGDDTLNGGTGDDVLKGGQDNDVLHGGDGRDKLNGGSHDDLLFGGDGKDYLHGYHGNDTLDGGDGNDKIAFGRGEDIATGGAGSDVFIFKSGDIDGSENVITDFTQNDRLDLRGLQLDQEQDDVLAWVMQSLTAEDNGDAVLDLGDGTTIRMAGMCETETEQQMFFDTVDDWLIF